MVEIKSYSTHHIKAIIGKGDDPPWRFIGFYGHHETHNRKHSWNLIRLLYGLSVLPTIFIADFNEILSIDEYVSHKRLRPQWQIDSFSRVVKDCEMFDIGYSGYNFTWCNNFISTSFTRARLDRCLASKSWRDRFPSSKLQHLSTNTSDHLPLLLTLGPQSLSSPNHKSRFKFEGGWCLYEESKEIVQETWDKSRPDDSGIQVLESIWNTRLGLLKWKREKLGHVQNTIKAKQALLDSLQQGTITLSSKHQACVLAKDIDRLREVDEVYWCQRSRALWRVKGDRNTAYFHVLSVDRGKINQITAIEDDHGVLQRDMTKIHLVAGSFYKHLFSSQTEGNIIDFNVLPTRHLEDNSQAKLDEMFTNEEVKQCLFSMSGNKSPGPDGMPALFFQHVRDIVGSKICRMVLNALNNGVFLRKFNFTLITLIPKVEHPLSMTQFRPIALCNTVAKIIAKALALRLKKVMPDIISDTQSAFMPERLII
ncbi:hypothetical protein LIER_15078 [Lithospermum erythrorhizon]|uniref:Reverse transcriptase domain-containing protein n=1 Tax=Lithospermum erythrorhizon TaxID=34254 RepID=A0AAV3Q628_LITER